MKKIAIVIQRYGTEVNGGAELHCRLLAQKLCEHGENVDVLSTCAIDHISWANHYPEGWCEVNGVPVLRFSTEMERDLKEFNAINRRFIKGKLTAKDETAWIEKQGPYCPALIRYIKEHEKDYISFVFYTYLYYPTVMGLPGVAERAVLIPTAHDEPYLHMNIMRDVFLKPKAILYNTHEERDLVWRVFHNKEIPSAIGGVGIELPEDINAERFSVQYGNEPFVLYVGRIEKGKNVDELLRFFACYKKKRYGRLRLILIGKSNMRIPKRRGILSLGYINEQTKYDAMAAAECVIIPSKYESLSMVMLEAMAVGTPVLVNAACEVLKGHCDRSEGALAYRDYHEFSAMLDSYLEGSENKREMIEKARNYVVRNYQWSRVLSELLGLIDREL